MVGGQHLMEKPNAIIFAVDFGEKEDFQHSLDEMKGLVEACDMNVVGTMTQALPHPDNATYIGSGKAQELKEYIKTFEAEFCICEGDMSPSQTRNLKQELGVEVWDRTNLILEIFSRRAKSREATLQVEYAYLQFMLPRLSGMWQHLGRQGGGRFANKGEGEKQIELDRRQIKHRMAELSKELDQISRTRQVQREGRFRGEVPRVALVGYTNAGKSSLMNYLISGGPQEKRVFEKDMLFATLDTSIRRIECEGGKEFLLSDTVGFIEKLPAGLIKAFRSTLEEAKYADLLLIVLDSSDPFNAEHRRVTEETLRDLETDTIPRIYVMNKADMLPVHPIKNQLNGYDRVYISAKTGDGIDVLLETILGQIYSNNELIEAVIPYSKAELLNRIHKYADIESEEYEAEGVKIKCKCSKKMAEEILR